MSLVDVKIEVPEDHLLALSGRAVQRLEALLDDSEDVVTFQVPERYVLGIRGKVTRDAATALMALAQGHDVRAVLDTIDQRLLEGGRVSPTSDNPTEHA